jgi:hypothetical protein
VPTQPTNPFPAGDIRYADRRSARYKLQQQGQFNQLLLNRPLQAKLRTYEKMVRQDLTIHSAEQTRVNSIVGSIGLPVHPDEEIQEFHRNSLLALEDHSGKAWEQVLREIQFTKDWAGFSVSEVCYNLTFGALTLKDVLTYHPTTITIYPDKDGLLTEGSKTLSGHKSGIFQHHTLDPRGERQLQMWKHIYLASNSEYGNYYGHSLVAPSYKWFRLKEVLVEMMVSAMNDVGKRVTWIRSPSTSLGDEMILDPATGNERPKTTLEYIQEQLEINQEDLRHILLPQLQAGNDFKPEIGSIPSSDNFGDVFLNTLRFVDAESIRHIVPYFLIMDTNSLEAARERRMEVYFKTIYNERRALINHVVQKCLMTVQQWNFNRASAKIPPTFANQYSDRPEDRVATMQVVTGLTEKAYLNPLDSMDWAMVRQMAGLSEREQTSADVKFIKQILIEPLQKPTGEAVKKAEPGRPTGNVKPQQQDRQPAKPAAGNPKKNLKEGG